MSEPSAVQIREVKFPGDTELVRQLWTDYLIWGNENMQQLYGVHPHDPENQVAHALYRKFGFVEIAAYPKVEIPEAFQQYLLFMELDLRHSLETGANPVKSSI